MDASSAAVPLSEDIEELHRLACASNKSSYKDPATGYSVFTADFHRKRGKCCGNMCRHCPFDHINVPDQWKTTNTAGTGNIRGKDTD